MTAAKAPVLSIQELSYEFPGGIRALDQVRLTIQAGESVALVGPNGSGKSTLLLHAVGLLPSPAVRIGGQDPTRRKDLPGIRRFAGLLFQDPDDQLFMPTVLEDVAFGPANFGQSPEEARTTAEKVLADLGLSHLADRPSHHLSGGEKKLVALAAVLACNPEFLVLDEPSAGLDPASRRRLLEILTAWQEQDKTLLLATHDLDLAFGACRRTIVLTSGRILAEGPTERLLADAELMARARLEVCLSVQLAACREK